MFKRIYARFHSPSTSPPLSTAVTQKAAKDAIDKADKGMTEVLSREPQITYVVEALRAQRDRNHFAELLEATMRGNG